MSCILDADSGVGTFDADICGAVDVTCWAWMFGIIGVGRWTLGCWLLGVTGCDVTQMVSVMVVVVVAPLKLFSITFKE